MPNPCDIVRFEDKDWIVIWIREGKAKLSRLGEEAIVPLQLLN